MDQDFVEFLAYLDSLHYFQRRLVIKRRIQPSQSRFIYKYKSIDPSNSQSEDRIRDLLVRSNLWLSSPLDFNDPFDTSIKITVVGTGKEKRERFKTLLKERGYSWKQREKELSKMSIKSNEDIEKGMAEAYQNNLKKVGIYSFAGDPKNIQMWSHYAGEHTGICIQFERSRDIVVLSGAIIVNHSPEYPEINYLSDFTKSLGNVILRKHEGWAYEKEHRILRPGDAHKLLKFEPSAIVGIILGCRIDGPRREIIDQLLEERERAGMPPIKLYSARKHTSRYQLCIVRDSAKS